MIINVLKNGFINTHSLYTYSLEGGNFPPSAWRLNKDVISLQQKEDGNFFSPTCEDLSRLPLFLIPIDGFHGRIKIQNGLLVKSGFNQIHRASLNSRSAFSIFSSPSKF